MLFKILLKLLLFIKKFLIIFISYITNNKTLNLYKSSYIVKFFNKLTFFKRYFSMWKYFTLTIKIFTYLNIVLSVILLYLFTDYNAAYTFVASCLASIYLYDNSSIINFIKFIFKKFINFFKLDWTENFKENIKDKIEESKEINKPKKEINIPKKEINITSNSIYNDNILNSFDYKKYLLIGLGGLTLLSLGTYGFYNIDFDLITWSNSWYVLSTYLLIPFGKFIINVTYN